MKKKIIGFFCIFLISGILLSSCGKSYKYEEKTINAYYINEKNNTTCNLRYYEDSVIPYISLENYVSLLYRGRNYPKGRDKFEVSKNKDVYTVTVAGDYTAKFDIVNNTLESDDLWSFKSTSLTGYGDKATISYDGLPFVRVKSVEYSSNPKKTIIDLDDYNLNMYGDDKAIYVPLTFATDLFSNENILQGAYNTKDLYFTNFTENENLSSFGNKYYDPIFENPLNQEYANYVYNELCLDYDYFLGRPGRSSLEVYYDLSKGLDKALDSRPLGKIIKEYMKSTDLIKFLVGSTILGYLRNDGGHSSYIPLETAFYDSNEDTYLHPSWLDDSEYIKGVNLLKEIYNTGYDELTNYDRQFYGNNNVRLARSEKLSKSNGALKGTETYTKVGDIAYIHIDGFMGEIELQNEWNNYYSGKRADIPFDENMGGAVGAISYGVIEASTDPEIKHLVVDLASNTGGSTDEMLFMVGLLTGSNKFYTYNRVSGRYVTASYEFDYNLDKVFDEKDIEMTHLLDNIDITVLTTRSGFSCGGISPIYLHEEGLFTVGEECGGGSCSIYIQYDAYGNTNRASCPSQTVTKNKVSIDVARKSVCDYKMEFLKDGVYDYSNLYDTDNLRKLIIEHYNN